MAAKSSLDLIISRLPVFGLKRSSRNGAKKMSDILKEVAEKIEGFGTVKQARILKGIFGLRSIAGTKILIDNIKNLDDYEKKLESVGDVAGETANFMRTSLGNRLKALGSAANEVGFQLLDAFQKEGKGGIIKLTEFLRKIDTKPVIEGIRTVVRITGEMFEKFKEFGESTGLFQTMKDSIEAAIPFFKDVIKFSGEVRQKFIDIAKRTGLFDKISTGIKAVVPFFKTVLSVMTTIFAFLERIGVFDAIAKGIGFVIEGLVKLGDKFSEIFNKIKPFIDGIRDFADLTEKLSKLEFKKGFESFDPLIEGRTVGERFGRLTDVDRLQSEGLKLIQNVTSSLRGAIQLDIAGAPKGTTVRTNFPGSNNNIDFTVMGVDEQ